MAPHPPYASPQASRRPSRVGKCDFNSRARELPAGGDYQTSTCHPTIPPEHVTLAEAAPKIREGVFPELQKRAFTKLVEEAMSRHKIELHPEHLPK